MSSHLQRFVSGDRELILLGTAHVSRASVDEVRRIIAEEQPDTVCVELDAGRWNSLSNPRHWESLDVFQVIRQGKGFFMLANLALSAFQRRLGEDLEVKPGEEMKAAVDEAEARQLTVQFIDRDVGTTLRRAWALSGFWGKNKLLAALVSSALGGDDDEVAAEDIERLKDGNELSGLMDGLAKELPKVKEVLIDERDRYLASRLHQAPGRKILAVVGAGHVPGMMGWLEGLATGARSPETTDIETVPAPGWMSKVLPWLIPALLTGLLVWGFVGSGVEVGWNLVLTWVLATGVPSAVGTLLVWGHPFTILAALVTAPLTTLHPALGVGMVTGLIETLLRKPKIADLETLNHDLTSFKGFWKNRLTHILLVMVGSSIGAILGNWFGLTTLVTQLVGAGAP